MLVAVGPVEGEALFISPNNVVEKVCFFEEPAAERNACRDVMGMQNLTALELPACHPMLFRNAPNRRWGHDAAEGGSGSTHSCLGFVLEGADDAAARLCGDLRLSAALGKHAMPWVLLHDASHRRLAHSNDRGDAESGLSRGGCVLDDPPETVWDALPASHDGAAMRWLER